MFAGVANALVWQQWQAFYGHGNRSKDCISDMVVDQNGNVYVTGTINEDTNQENYLTIKYDTFGQILWFDEYDGPAGLIDVAAAIALDNDGNVYVTGQSKGIDSDYDYATIKYDTDGQRQWIARYNGPSSISDKAYDVAIDQDGNVYITGTSYDPGTMSDYATVKYNSAGQELWVERYDTPFGGPDEAYRIAIDNSGGVYVTGRSGGDCQYEWDYATIKYSSQGDLLWVQRYDWGGDTDDSAYLLTMDNDGNIYVSGTTVAPPPDFYGVTIVYDPAGTQLRMIFYQFVAPRDIAVDDFKNVYLACDNGFRTVKYDSTGTMQWQKISYGIGNGESAASAIGLDTDGSVYVTGNDYSHEYWYNSDIVTAKYTTQGELVWQQRFGSPETMENLATSLAVDADNNVYVAGQLGLTWYNTDYATLKYSQSDPDLEFYIIPVGGPVQIPPSGGNFMFEYWMWNNEPITLDFDFWIKIQLPNGTWVGPVLGPVSVHLQPDQSLSDEMSQSIPANAPAGTYNFVGYIGDYPQYTWIDSGFAIEKIGNSTNSVFTFDPNGSDFIVSSQEKLGDSLPSAFNLALHPNPFNPTTNFSFSIPETEHVILKVFNLQGQLVETLINGLRDAGSYNVTFDASALSSGIYLYQLTAGQNTASGKMVLVK